MLWDTRKHVFSSDTTRGLVHEDVGTVLERKLVLSRPDLWSVIPSLLGEISLRFGDLYLASGGLNSTLMEAGTNSQRSMI